MSGKHPRRGHRRQQAAGSRMPKPLRAANRDPRPHCSLLSPGGGCVALRFAGLMGRGRWRSSSCCWLVLLLAAGVPRVRRRWPGMRAEMGMLGLLTALFCLFFWRLLFEQGVAIPKGGGDFNSFYYPLSAFAANQIQTRAFPALEPVPLRWRALRGGLSGGRALSAESARLGGRAALHVRRVRGAGDLPYLVGVHDCVRLRADDRPAPRPCADRRDHLRVWRLHDRPTRSRADDRRRLVAARGARCALSRTPRQRRVDGRRRARSDDGDTRRAPAGAALRADGRDRIWRLPRLGGAARARADHHRGRRRRDPQPARTRGAG